MDTTTNSNPVPTTVPPTNPADEAGDSPSTPRARSGLNATQAARLKKAEDIVTTALDEKYQPTLCDTSASLLPADHPSQMSKDRLTRLRDAIVKARADSARAVGETASSQDATPAIELAETRLVAAIQRVQKRARQKYLRRNPELLAKYHIGDRLADNRANLEQFANNVLNHASPIHFPA